MSLFPAYLVNKTSGPNSPLKDGPDEDKVEWLENKSFPSQLRSSSTSKSTRPAQHRQSEKERKHKRRHSSSENSSPQRKPSPERSSYRQRARRSRSRNGARQSRSRSRARKSRSRESSRKSRAQISRSRDRKSRRSRSRTRNRKKNKSSRPKETRRPTTEELVAKYSTNKIFLEDVGLKPENAYRNDSRGNAQYLKYKCLPFSETAHYKASWKREMLTICDGRNRFLTSSERRQSENFRFFHKDYQKIFLRPEQRGEILNLSTSTNRPEITSKDFNAHKLTFADVKTCDVTYKDKLDQSNDIEDFKLHQIQLKTKEFNENLRKNSRDEKLWLEFVDFQDQVLRDCSFLGEDETKKSGKSKNKSGNPVLRQKVVAEKKLSVLRTALKDNPNSIPLLTKKLKVSSEILDSATLDQEWKELLFRYPASVPLWKDYLRFLSSQFSMFSVTKMVGALADCIDRFKKIPGSSEEQIVFVIQLAANIWGSSGFREKGVALYQALIELNLNSSSESLKNSSLEDQLTFFEQFWDCSASRIGDQGSVGWQNVLKNKISEFQEMDPDPREAEDQLLTQAGGRVAEAKLWLAIELYRETRHWQPYRFREEEPDDPDRAVPFDDLKPFLVVFEEPSSRFRLVASFLRFLGVTFYAQAHDPANFDFCNLQTETMQRWMGFLSPDSFLLELEGSLLQRITPDLESDPSLQVFVRNIFNQLMAVLEDPLRTQICVLWLHFEHEMARSPENEPQTKKRILKEMKHSVKKILETDRNNILLYCSYAQTLHRLESFQSAHKILETVLSADKSSHVFRVAVALELEAHLALTNNNITAALPEGDASPHLDEAIWLLFLMATGQAYSKRVVDKVGSLALAHEAKAVLTRKLFEEQNEFRYDGPAIRRSSPLIFQSELFDQVFCLVWLNALTDPDTDQVEQIIDKICSGLKEDKTFESRILREHLSAKLRLDVLTFHWNKRSSTKARSVLKNLLILYPSNPVVLDALSSKSDLRPTVTNPFWRESLKILSSKDVSSPLGLIFMTKILIGKFMEANQGGEDDNLNNVVSVGYLNKVLSILENATQQESTKQVAVIWRLLMWVTKTLAEINPNKKFSQESIKSIFYRSIQECPCAKVLYLDLINYLDDTLDSSRDQLEISDLSRVQHEIEEIMSEKEVRVRLPTAELKVLLEPEEDLVSD